MAERGHEELKNLIENLRSSESQRIEFWIKHYNLVEPVVVEETGVHLVPTDTVTEGVQLVKGFVQLSSLNEEEVVRALGEIERTISVMCLRQEEEKLEWWLAIPHAESWGSARRTQKDFDELDKMFGCIKARFKTEKMKNMYYRAIDMYRHACKTLNPVDRFLFDWNCIEIVSEIYYQENKHSFKRTKLEKEECIKKVLGKKDPTNQKTIHECYEKCLHVGIPKKVGFTFKSLFKNISDILIDIFFNLDDETEQLCKIRNDIVHGNISMYNVKDVLFVERRERDIHFIALELLHRAIGLTVCGDSIKIFLTHPCMHYRDHF